MVSDLKPVAYKGVKLPHNFFFFGEFCFTSRIFFIFVLLSALVKRCFISHIGDFKKKFCKINTGVIVHATLAHFLFIVFLNRSDFYHGPDHRR